MSVTVSDSGGTGDESGFATIGGRNIFLEDGELDRRRNDRYAGWDTASDITGGATLQ